MKRFVSLFSGLSFAVATMLGSAGAAQAGSMTAAEWVKTFGAEKHHLDLVKHKHRGWCGEGDKRPECQEPVADTNIAAVAPSGHDLTVDFEFDSDILTSSAKEGLTALATALKNPELLGTRYDIDGFTDAKGETGYNQSLSIRRARAVADFLVSIGVKRDQLVAKGFGSSKPRVGDPYAAENRRVEAKLVD